LTEGLAPNPGTVIGSNVNIHKGLTIGQENRGKRKGAPIIGDCVWIGVNATIVGNIHIGNDVLIAPNSYVNFDVPDHSIVIGNPAKLVHRENATEGYINHRV
jgi:serine O-acetyltransferase